MSTVPVNNSRLGAEGHAIAMRRINFAIPGKEVFDATQRALALSRHVGDGKSVYRALNLYLFSARLVDAPVQGSDIVDEMRCLEQPDWPVLGTHLRRIVQAREYWNEGRWEDYRDRAHAEQALMFEARRRVARGRVPAPPGAGRDHAASPAGRARRVAAVRRARTGRRPLAALLAAWSEQGPLARREPHSPQGQAAIERLRAKLEAALPATELDALLAEGKGLSDAEAISRVMQHAR